MRIVCTSFRWISFHKSGIIKSSQKTLYSTISNTQNYPSFIPYINSAKIIKQVSQMQNYTQFIVSYGSFTNLSYVLHMKMKSAQKLGDKAEIRSQCKDENLTKFNSVWEIIGKDQSSAYVDYKMEFQFSNPIYKLASSVVKDYMGEQMWNLIQKQSIIQQENLDRPIRQQKLQQTVIITSDQNPTQLNTINGTSVLKNKNLNIQQQHIIAPQQCKISKLAQFLMQNPQLKIVYEQSSSNRSKIQQYHYRLESSPDYEAELKAKILELVKMKTINFYQ